MCFSVLGLGNGNTALESLYRSHVTRVNIKISYSVGVSHLTLSKAVFIKLLKLLPKKAQNVVGVFNN